MENNVREMGRGKASRLLFVLAIFVLFLLLRPGKVMAAETAEVKWANTYGMSVPDSVTLYLLRNGADTGNTTTATKAGGWAFSFGKMPLRDGGGKAYTYSVKEDTGNLEPGYTTTSSEFNAEKNQNLKITMNSSSKTESGCDYLIFYYRGSSGTLKKSENIGGSIGGKTYIIPAKDFYIYWYSDGSVAYYGFKIDSVVPTTEASSLTFSNASALPNYTATEKQGTDYPETGHNYGNNENILWHYTADNTINISVTNKGKYLAGGTWGTCPWTISNDGVLAIGAGTGADVGYNHGNRAPWYAYNDKITSVKTTGTVVLPADSSYLFYGLSSAKSIDMSGFNTEKASNMSYMFSGCKALTSLDLSNFNTGKATDMHNMFENCFNLTTLDLSNFDTGSVKNMGFMFSGCKALTSLDLSKFNAESATDMRYMFKSCSGLTSLNLSSFNTGKATNMSGMFLNCSSLTSLDLSNFDTGSVKNMGFMFSSCKALTSLDLSNFDTGNVTDVRGMFNDCKALTSLDLSNFDTGNVTDMWQMFYGCKALTSLDLSNFNTGKATDMHSMFENCFNLTTLDLSNFDTGNVTNMWQMFCGCKALTSLDLSNFDTKNVWNLSGMFYDCKTLTSLDLSNFDTGNVTNMSYMFDGCSSLTSLGLSNFDTANATYMTFMFYGCSSLKSVRLGTKAGLTDKRGSTSNFRDIVPKAKTGESIDYTGKWTKSSPYNHTDSISGEALEIKYATNSSSFGSFEPATYVWEIDGKSPYEQEYQSDNGITNGRHNVLNITSDTSADAQIAAFATDKNGNKTGYWTKLSDGTWTYTFFVYKANVPWKVYEDSMSGYSGDHAKDSILNIADGRQEAVITNTSNKVAAQKYGSLKITKKLEAAVSNAQAFSFEVSLTDETGKVISGNKIFGDTAFSDGKATVSVPANGSATISDIPAGYHYQIREIPNRGYRQVSFSNNSGTISEAGTEAVCTNKFVPARETSPDKPAGETVSVVINKICSSQTDKFKFSINISDINAGESISAEIKETAESPAQKVSYSPDDTGEINAEAEISGGGSINLLNIPVGAEYRITEQPSEYLASYEITDASNKGLIKKASDANTEVGTALSTFNETADSGETVSINFTNEKPTYPVSFTKRDSNDDFVEGAELEVSGTDGTKKASWTTIAGESKEIVLEPGTYTLHEISAPSGYGIASDIQFTVSDDGKILIEGAEVSDIEMIDTNTEKTVSVSKVDDSGFPVQGAELKLTDSGTGKAIDSWRTESVPHDVKLEFGKTYVLSETVAPSGYEKAADIKLTVSSDGKLTVDGEAADGDVIYMTDPRKPYILPSTGGSGNIRMMAFLIAAASIFILSAALEKTKRDRGDQ